MEADRQIQEVQHCIGLLKEIKKSQNKVRTGDLNDKIKCCVWSLIGCCFECTNH